MINFATDDIYLQVCIITWGLITNRDWLFNEAEWYIYASLT